LIRVFTPALQWALEFYRSAIVRNASGRLRERKPAATTIARAGLSYTGSLKQSGLPDLSQGQNNLLDEKLAQHTFPSSMDELLLPGRNLTVGCVWLSRAHADKSRWRLEDRP